MQACAGTANAPQQARGNKRETKWLELKSQLIEHELCCLQPEKIFITQHKINMLEAEIAATKKAIARVG